MTAIPYILIIIGAIGLVALLWSLEHLDEANGRKGPRT